jgi:hypothetical protein
MLKGFLAVATIAVFSAAALSAAPDTAAPDGNAPVVKKEEALYIFLTGNELSSLQPCGCAEKQLGGFEKRPSVWRDIPTDRRLIIDTGNLLLKTDEQDLIKFDIMVQAFSLLGYDVVNFTKADFDIAAPRGYLVGTTFRAITPRDASGNQVPAVFTREFVLASRPVSVNVATVESLQSNIPDTASLLPAREPGKAVNILICNVMFEKIDTSLLASVPLDVLVCLSGSDTPEIIENTNIKPLVVTVGRTGKYVGKLTIQPAGETLSLAYEAVAVEQELPSAPALVDLYKNYQQIVKEENLLDKYPRSPLPGKLEYVGSRSCKVCHEKEYAQCATMKHTVAWKGLVDVGSSYDPECVVCHVVGQKYQGGFVSARKTPELRDVGCEECHGPGSRHLETLGKAKTQEPKAQCTDCHTTDNSPKYAGHEEEYRSKIVHWKEQKDANSVKK